MDDGPSEKAPARGCGIHVQGIVIARPRGESLNIVL
jgi:hypothetical protein